MCYFVNGYNYIDGRWEKVISCRNIEECQHRGESDYVRAGILKTIDSGGKVEYLKRNIQEAAGMLKAEYDYGTDMAVKARESYELGMEQGIQVTARSMLADNMDAALVARYTSLPLEEVMQLQRRSHIASASRKVQ